MVIGFGRGVKLVLRFFFRWVEVRVEVSCFGLEFNLKVLDIGLFII